MTENELKKKSQVLARCLNCGSRDLGWDEDPCADTEATWDCRKCGAQWTLKRNGYPQHWNQEYKSEWLEKVVAEKLQDEEFTTHCLCCAHTTDIQMYPLRKEGLIVGWLFVCDDAICKKRLKRYRGGFSDE